MKELLVKESIATWLAIMALLFALAGWVEAQTYQVTDLGQSIPFSINNHGDIVGSAFFPSAGGWASAIYANGQWTRLDGIIPHGIDDQGTIYGFSATEQPQAATLNGTLTLLPNPRGIDSGGTQATARTPDGTVWGHGSFNAGAGDIRPLRWRNKQVVQLQRLGGHAEVTAANVHKNAVGFAEDAHGVTHAVWWGMNTRIHVLPTLPGITGALAEAINSDNLMCGVMLGSQVLPTCWDIYGGIYQLPLLPGYLNASVTAMNDPAGDLAHVVGPAGRGADAEVAVMWGPETQRQVAVPLHTLVQAPGWTFERPTGINNANQIIGFNWSNGQYRGWLLTPVEQVAGR